MSNRFLVAVFAITIGLVFFATGVRYDQVGTYSPPICGPLTDQYGNPAGNAGPCPSFVPFPTAHDGGWYWAPFWVPEPPQGG